MHIRGRRRHNSILHTTINEIAGALGTRTCALTRGRSSRSQEEQNKKEGNKKEAKRRKDDDPLGILLE